MSTPQSNKEFDTPKSKQTKEEFNKMLKQNELIVNGFIRTAISATDFKIYEHFEFIKLKIIMLKIYNNKLKKRKN